MCLVTESTPYGVYYLNSTGCELKSWMYFHGDAELYQFLAQVTITVADVHRLTPIVFFKRRVILQVLHYEHTVFPLFNASR